jgi:hypothetical protein
MYATQLRDALGSHLGRVLTPEVAVAIFEAAVQSRAEPIDIDQFEPLEADGFVIRAERFVKVLPELQPLHEEHWIETEKYRHGLELKPDYDAMAERERAGRLLQFTARRDGMLAGHLRMYLGQSLHTQTLFAEEDTLFVRKQYRGGFMVMKLMRYAEAALLQLGVREVRANSKVGVNRADVLMRRLGYAVVAMQFVKFFKESE